MKMMSISGWATFFLALLPSAAAIAAWRPNGGYNYAHGVPMTLEKRQIDQSPFTTGLPLVNGSIPIRVEIRQMQKYHEQWTLYLLALSWLQYTDQEDAYSWYRLAGMCPASHWCFSTAHRQCTLAYISPRLTQSERNPRGPIYRLWGR